MNVLKKLMLKSIKKTINLIEKKKVKTDFYNKKFMDENSEGILFFINYSHANMEKFQFYFNKGILFLNIPFISSLFKNLNRLNISYKMRYHFFFFFFLKKKQKSKEHTSELNQPSNFLSLLFFEKKKKQIQIKK